jgi:hypothetical protein
MRHSLPLLVALAACKPAAETGDSAATLGPDGAWVFEINPLATPEPVAVDLPLVADDQGGALTSAEDEEGVRRLQVLSCEDEGETTVITGMGMFTICTLRARANKDERGDFGYDDWGPALAGEYDPDDVHAEVSLYHHASRFYDVVVDPDVGLYDRLPLIHDAGGEPVPLTLVANYRAPMPGEGVALEATDQAFHLTADMLAMGMDAFAGLQGIPGDVLAFGQGRQADFAYDGETVYHELGHVVTWSVGGLQHHVGVDEYGLNNLTPALEQGVTETLVSLTSGRTSLFDWLDEVSGAEGYARDLDNADVYPDNMGGIGPFDGMVVAAAHHDAWVALQAAGLDRAGFVRLLLLTLEANQEPDLNHSFHRWAELFLETLEAEGHGTELDTVRALFEARGLFETVRARSLASLQADGAYLVVGGAAQEPWNTWIEATLGGQDSAIGTAYVQIELPTGVDSLSLEGSVMGLAGEMASDPQGWDPLLLVRAGEPVHYEHQEGGGATVTTDRVVTPDLITQGDGASLSVRLEGLDAGQPHYLHIVNRGEAAFLLHGLTVE